MPWLAVLLGPIAGSFLTTLIARLPQGEGFVLGRSRCPACGHVVAARHLVPIVSWLWLRGQCARCRAPIGAAYPLIEIAATLIAMWAALTLDGWLVWATSGLGWMLLAIAAIDWRHFVIPDGLVVALGGLGLVDGAAERGAGKLRASPLDCPHVHRHHHRSRPRAVAR